MLLHDYLRRKSAILAKAKAEVDNLLTEISHPHMRAAVDEWELGDPITEEYAQVDQKAKPEESSAQSEPQAGSLVSDTHQEDHGMMPTTNLPPVPADQGPASPTAAQSESPAPEAASAATA